MTAKMWSLYLDPSCGSGGGICSTLATSTSILVLVPFEGLDIRNIIIGTASELNKVFYSNIVMEMYNQIKTFFIYMDFEI